MTKNTTPEQCHWLAEQFRRLTVEMRFTPLTLEDTEEARGLSFDDLVHRCGSNDLAMEFLELGAKYEAWRRRHLEALFDRQRAEDHPGARPLLADSRRLAVADGSR